MILSDNQVKQGQQWFLDHNEHVIKLIKSAKTSFAPSGSDKNHPELWKAASWKWFNECGYISVHGIISTLWSKIKYLFGVK